MLTAGNDKKLHNEPYLRCSGNIFDMGVPKKSRKGSSPQCAQIWKIWKKIHILAKNLSLRLVEGSLEAKSEGLSEKSQKNPKKSFFGGLGPNFHIWA